MGHCVSSEGVVVTSSLGRLAMKSLHWDDQGENKTDEWMRIR